MVDKIKKALSKLSYKERQKFKEILTKIEAGNLQGLDIKRLKQRKDIFRIRKGNMRIIFRKKADSIKILTLEKRTSKTYKK